ncbi:MAG: amidohydrolase family protein [Actinomycetota bacterium]|nr:amidohydrolase family protein [Actinomycetota bacterium]
MYRIPSYGDVPVVDAHVHLARRSSLKMPFDLWVQNSDPTADWAQLMDEQGCVRPDAIGALFASQGVDVSFLFAEYSPRVTGMQAIEDMLPVFESDRQRFRLVANLNPHLHYPVAAELERQLDLGAIALKIHPVHAGVAVDDKSLYPAYSVCEARGIPLIVHCGTSNFPGAQNKYGDPVHLDDLLRDFPDLKLVLAHGGRGWWYDAAAFLALTYPNVWIDLAGLPPQRLPEYYAKFDLARLARKWIFATDWPSMPGIAKNIDAVAELGLPDDVLAGVLGGNAQRVYHLGEISASETEERR